MQTRTTLVGDSVLAPWSRVKVHTSRRMAPFEVPRIMEEETIQSTLLTLALWK